MKWGKREYPSSESINIGSRADRKATAKIDKWPSFNHQKEVIQQLKSIVLLQGSDQRNEK